MIVCLVGAAFAGENGEELARTTDHYRITIDISPPTAIMTPEQATEAKEGHVVVNTQKIPMDLRDLMPTVDQGQPVNRLVEVFVYDKESGALRTDLVPRVAVVDQTTEWSRDLPTLAKMYEVQDGPDKSCFGISAYLNGSYRILVSVEGETATFQDISVDGPAIPSSASLDSSAQSDT